jgi:UDP-N-acetylmuramoylalanine--D-glutamate ligase
MAPTDKVVLELSSFQLMDLHYSPHIAVVTNLSPNHLDVHRDMEEYIEAKTHIFTYQKEGDILIVNGDNAITKEFCSRGERRTFARMGDGDVTYRDEQILLRGEPILRREDILLPGIHNVENYMTAILAVDGMVSAEDIRYVARTFGGVEHRIELVRVKDGVRFYNDSIASSPGRTMAGLRSFKEKVILIAGGYDKKLPFEELGEEIVQSVKLLVATGATGPRIAEATRQAPAYELGKPEIIEIPDFYAAVHKAAELAQEGDVVLLSPAGPAFDRFKNFMVRGKEFKKTVMEL